MPYVRQGKAALDAGDAQAAIAHFRTASGLDPECAQAYHGLGVAYLQIDDTYRAEIFIRKAISLDKHMTDLWGYLGDIYLRQGDEAKAMEYFDKCPPADPHYAELHFRLGKMRLSQANVDDADAEFAKCLAHADFWGGFAGKGWVAERKNDFAASLEWFTEAQKRAQNREIYAGLANAYYQLGNFQSAYFYYTLTRGCLQAPEPTVDARVDELRTKVPLPQQDVEPKFELAIERNAMVKAGVYDAQGKYVKMIFEGMLTKGKYTLTWDGCDARGKKCPTGEYLGYYYLGDNLHLCKFLVR